MRRRRRRARRSQLAVPGGGAAAARRLSTRRRARTRFELAAARPDGARRRARRGSNVVQRRGVRQRAGGRGRGPSAWCRRARRARSSACARSSSRTGAQPAATRRPLLPNLKAVPPYEFGFVAPANPLNAAYPPDTVNPPLSVAGQEPLSCAPDELAPVAAGGGGARDCLRLTTGPINAGDGPFIKPSRSLSDAAGGGARHAPPYVRGERAAGDLCERRHDDAARRGHVLVPHDARALPRRGDPHLRALPRRRRRRSSPRARARSRASARPTSSSASGAPSGRTRRGRSARATLATGSCYGAADDGMFALTRGWGDVYRWQRPGPVRRVRRQRRRLLRRAGDGRQGRHDARDSTRATTPPTR